jgi:fumarate reductase subunit C
MSGWWRRDPFFGRYLRREATALAVVAYALVLLAGLFALWRGEAAYAHWRRALDSPASLVLHGLAFVAFAFHAWSWFQVMPKTAPRLRVPDRAVVGGAVAVTLVVSVLLVALLRRAAS